MLSPVTVPSIAMSSVEPGFTVLLDTPGTFVAAGLRLPSGGESTRQWSMVTGLEPVFLTVAAVSKPEGVIADMKALTCSDSLSRSKVAYCRLALPTACWEAIDAIDTAPSET